MENKRVLIDTSILIDYFRKEKKEKTLFYQLYEQYEIVISVITEFEWLVGFKNENIEFGTKLIENIEILNFDSKCVLKAREIYLELKRKSKLIEIPDILIAATSLAYNMPLVTFNLEHFERIDSLIIIK